MARGRAREGLEASIDHDPGTRIPGERRHGVGAGSARAAGPPTHHADLDYAPPEPATSNGHKLDLYLPSGAKPWPVVIWTGGSAWMADTGKRGAGALALRLNPAGYAVAGVSIRSSSQVRFPGQLHDIKAAVRWLRADAARYNLDADHIAIMGDSSGGWTAAMAAVTGDAPEMEGSFGTTGVSSAVQAAVAFYPPTDFLAMDAWAVSGARGPGATTARLPRSPASSDVPSSPAGQGAGSQPAAVRHRGRSAPHDPARHSDPLVPHNQGERLYMALNKACLDAVFISLPKAPHGNWTGFLTDDALREAATMRSTSTAGCSVTNPTPEAPTWQTVIEFLDKHMKRG